MLIAHSGAAAAFDPYVSGTVGYDYSYVQCGLAAPKASFGIVGVNAGYPFTYYNSCLASEYAAASGTGNGAVYINAGYDPTYTAIDGRHTTQDCATRSQAITGTVDQQAAWAVGCSEAQRDGAYATAQSVSGPTAWWLDVETVNSWSSTDLSLNQYTIAGIIATLRSQTAGRRWTPTGWRPDSGASSAQRLRAALPGSPASKSGWSSTGPRSTTTTSASS